MICMQFVTMLCKQFRCFQFRSILTFMCNVKGVGRGLILPLKLPKPSSKQSNQGVLGLEEGGGGTGEFTNWFFFSSFLLKPCLICQTALELVGWGEGGGRRGIGVTTILLYGWWGGVGMEILQIMELFFIQNLIWFVWLIWDWWNIDFLSAFFFFQFCWGWGRLWWRGLQNAKFYSFLPKALSDLSDCSGAGWVGTEATSLSFDRFFLLLLLLEAFGVADDWLAGPWLGLRLLERGRVLVVFTRQKKIIMIIICQH